MSDTPATQPDTHLDTQGLICPEPVMLLHQAVRKARSGACIEVIATDPSSQRDIPKFCLHLGHTLVKHEVLPDNGQGECYRYWIIKA